jgi:hypothetical protein
MAISAFGAVIILRALTGSPAHSSSQTARRGEFGNADEPPTLELPRH